MTPRAPELGRLGFPTDDDAWFDRIRAVEQSAPLGRIGDYTLDDEVGRGGQGVVYRGRTGNRTVAVKRLLHGAFASEQSRVRFEREIEAARALRHDGIVGVVDVIYEGGQRFLVMDWIAGEPLSEWAANGGARRSVDEIVRLCRQVCDALLHAHQRGVIHRDLKPSNVLVDAAGRARILDFGLAKLDADAASLSSLSVSASRPGSFMGTIAYAAPEQFVGDATGVDARSDLYSLAVLLHEMLTGELPYPLGTSLASAVHAITLEDPRRASERNHGVTRSLDAVIRKALAKSSDDRYPSIDAFARDLDRVLAGEPVEAETTSVLSSMRRVMRRHPVAASVMSVLSLVVIAFGVTMTVLYRSAERNALRASRVEVFLESTLSPGMGPDGEPIDELDYASARATEELSAEPDIELRVRERLALRYASSHRWTKALTEADRALSLRETLRSPRDARYARLLHVRGLARVVTRDCGGLDDLEEARGHFASVVGDPSLQVAETWGALGFARARCLQLTNPSPPNEPRELAGLEPAIESFETAIEMFDRYPDQPTEALARTLLEYGDLLSRTVAWERSVSYLARSREVFRALPPGHPGLITATQRHGEVLSALGRQAEAEVVLREAIELRDGAMDWRLPASYGQLANTFFHRGRHDEALHFYILAIVNRCHDLSQRHPDHRAELQSVASRVRDEGLHAGTADAFRTAIERAEPRVLPLFVFTGGKIATIYERRGDHDRAAGIRSVIDRD